MTSTAELDATIRATLDANELAHDHVDTGRFLVELPGTKKLQTNCWLIVGEHALVVEAFVCRRPDEKHEDVYRYLLRRNARLYGVHYTIDDAGDVYLIGRFSLESVTESQLDRVLGQVLEAADGDFNVLLEIGFATAIRREWGWRESRGESLANLQAFRSLVERDGSVAPMSDAPDD